MNALRVLIAVAWLAMSSLGASAIAMPAMDDIHPMACHDQGDKPPAPDDAAHKAMPCCTHGLNVLAPVAGQLSLVAVPLSHSVAPTLALHGFVLPLDPDPPRSA